MNPHTGCHCFNHLCSICVYLCLSVSEISPFLRLESVIFPNFRWYDKFSGKLFWPVFIWNRFGRNFWFHRSAILCGRERITQAVIRFFIKWRSWWQCHCRGNCRWWLFWLVITGSVMRRWRFAEREDTCSPLCHTEIFWQWWWDRVQLKNRNKQSTSKALTVHLCLWIKYCSHQLVLLI